MREYLQRNVYCLLGLPFDAMDTASAVRHVQDAAARRRPCFISTPNVNFIIGSRTDSKFRDSVIGSDLSIADGMPLVWVARLLGIPIRERVAGSALFEQLRKGTSGPLSVYFFGGKDGIAEAASRRLNAETSGLVCVGFESPGFGSIEELSSDESIEKINRSGADFLVVSLGAKKGQAWIEHNRARISVPAICHLGAVLNFAAGTVQRAPAWIQNTGLEWLWRIKEEPGLGRRYLSDGVALLRLLITHVLPFAWLTHWHKPTTQDLRTAAIESQDDGNETVIRLRGVWVKENLRPLRECFSAVALARRNLRIDLGQVSYVDSSFLGLLLLLYGIQKKHAKRLSCGPVSQRVQKIFEYGCGEFLLNVDAKESEAKTAPKADDVVLEDEEQEFRS